MIDDGTAEKTIEAQLILEAQYGSRDFSLPLFLSLSLCVCVIDQSMWVENFTRTTSFITRLVRFARERAKMKEKWSSCVSVVRGGVRRVSWLCFFRAGATSESAERWTLTKSDG